MSHAKRGAHMPPFLLTAREGFTSFEKVYGAANLANAENWYARGAEEGEVNVRILTVAPEVEGVMSAVKELSGRGMVVAIGHRLDMVLPPSKTRFWELMLDERWHTAPPARKSQPPRSGTVQSSSPTSSTPCRNCTTATHPSLGFSAHLHISRPLSHLCTLHRRWCILRTP